MQSSFKPQPDFSYDLHGLIRRRWSPRAFSAQPVAETTVLTLLEAAQWAASASNEQPWRFIYAVQAQAARYRALFDCLDEGNQEWAGAAPVLMLALVKTRFQRSGRPNRWALHDLGLAVGNLTTQASALDLYVHSMGGFSAERARAAFALPDDIEPVTMIAIGYLGDPELLSEKNKARELAPRQRKPLAELILNAGPEELSA
jgi:nitroreductase